MWDGREPDLRSQARNATLGACPTGAAANGFAATADREFRDLAVHSTIGRQSGRTPQLARRARRSRFSLQCSPSIPGLTLGPGSTPTSLPCIQVGQCDRRERRGGSSLSRAEKCCSTIAQCGSPACPDSTTFKARTEVMGTCTTCHNAPNVGSDSLFAMMDIGTGAPKADLPSYLILCNDGTQRLTTDPGRAMVTGKCADIGKFKVPGCAVWPHARRTSTTARPRP